MKFKRKKKDTKKCPWRCNKGRIPIKVEGIKHFRVCMRCGGKGRVPK